MSQVVQLEEEGTAAFPRVSPQLQNEQLSISALFSTTS